MNVVAGPLAVVLVSFVAVPCAAQQNTPPAPGSLLKGDVSLPSSVDKGKASRTPVLIIPEAEIFKGANLSDAQKTALISNLKTAPFKTQQMTIFSDRDLAAMRLPSGELFQYQPASNLAPGGWSRTLSPTNPCATPDHTDDELIALRKVLAAQLVAKKGDLNDFEKNIPADCRRRQLIYFLKSAAVIAR